MRHVETARRAGEALHFLADIEPDGIANELEMTRFRRLYEAGEIQGRHMYCTAPDLAFLRDLYNRQQADAYGIAA